MSDDRWARLNEIFHTATGLDADRRRAYLDEACAGDTELRARAERLIVAHESAGDFIDSPAVLTAGHWPDRDDEAVAPGQRFGPYRIVREIARGGMGAVYLAERADGQYEQRVALKVIRRSLDIDPLLHRFRAERQILASLEHANIARLLDGGTSPDGRPFFVMEYIDGEPIDRYARTRALSIADRLRLLLPICDAVAHAHDLGVVHRDIKPANILVTRQGVPKLLDFGIAKAASPDATGATAPLTGLRLLTPEYASPEQVEGRSATPASDIYSLGVVLYELLTGRSPYRPRSRDPLDIADAVRTTSPVSPSKATPPGTGRQLRGDLDTIVLAALRKEPERRYPSVDALATDLRRHLDGLPISARRDSVRYRTAKFLGRNRTAVLAAVGAGLVTALLAAAFGVRSEAPQSLLANGALAERDRIVVSHFTEQLNDPSLAVAITEAFRIDLAQSPRIRVLTPVQVRAALERMQHPGSAIPDDSVARELAMREGAKAFVSGSIARVGGAYTLSAQLISAESGEELTTLRETAADSTGLIAAVGRASGTLRQRLGESLRDVRTMPTLEHATTASLPALRKYTEGYRSFVRGDRTPATELLREAVALDTAFASAYFALASVYTAMAESGRAHDARQRAFAHRDRLPLRDGAMMIASDAYGRNDLETSIREYGRLLERYPSDVPILNNLALAHRDARNYEAAESLWTRAIAIDSSINVLYYGLHNVLVMQGRPAEGRRVLDIVHRRLPDDPVLPTVVVQQAVAEQSWDEAERLALINYQRLLGDSIQLVDAIEQLAGIAMTQGRLVEAERRWHEQIAVSTHTGSYGRRLFGALQLAGLHLRHYGQPERALAVVDSVLALQPLEDILPGDRPYGSLARFYAQLGDLARARMLQAAADSNDRALGLLQPAEGAWTRGVIALAEGRPADAEGALREAADRHRCPICPLPDVARGWEAVGRPDSALAAWVRYTDSPWLWRYKTDALEMGRALIRTGELHEARGERTEAARAYARLLQLWSRADGPLAQTTAEVRRRLARVGQAP